MIATARAMSLEPNTFWTDQLNNRDSLEGYIPLGEEIWSQTGGCGRCVRSRGRNESFAARRRDCAATAQSRASWCVAVEPAESPVLSGGAPGAHRIEGIGIGYVPPLWNPTMVNESHGVPTTDAEAMARRLAKEEGLFAGTSSGANVIAAIQLGLRLGPAATVATLLVDSGLKYLSTPCVQAHAAALSASRGIARTQCAYGVFARMLVVRRTGAASRIHFFDHRCA